MEKSLDNHVFYLFYLCVCERIENCLPLEAPLFSAGPVCFFSCSKLLQYCWFGGATKPVDGTESEDRLPYGDSMKALQDYE